MLHKESIERETFELLKSLMRDERLSDFMLAGGTSFSFSLQSDRKEKYEKKSVVAYPDEHLELVISGQNQF